MTGYRRALLVLMVAALCGGCAPPRPETLKDGVNLTGAPWGGPISLIDARGRPFSTASLKGDVLLLYFGYTRCTDVCVPTLHHLADTLKALGPQATSVRVVFVTVDPRADTPARLRAVMPTIDPRFIALTGRPAQIQAVLSQYKVASQENAHAPIKDRYVHSDGIYLEDRTGALRWYAPASIPIPVLVSDVRQLLSARAPAGTPASGH